MKKKRMMVTVMVRLSVCGWAMEWEGGRRASEAMHCISDGKYIDRCQLPIAPFPISPNLPSPPPPSSLLPPPLSSSLPPQWPSSPPSHSTIALYSPPSLQPPVLPPPHAPLVEPMPPPQLPSSSNFPHPTSRSVAWSANRAMPP